MYDDLACSLPESIDRNAILEPLDRVLDPELDESILKLGFVQSVEADEGLLTITLRLPTYWCAPNFSYLMVEDIRRELSGVENVQQVHVRLQDHFAADEIERGVNSGKLFTDAFPGEGNDNLKSLRDLFLRKGYLKRQEGLLRELRNAGLSFAQIAELRIDNVHVDRGSCRVEHATAGKLQLGADDFAQRYLERRRKLGIDSSPRAPLIVDLKGQPVSATKLEQYFVYARTVRVSLDANGSLCGALLDARHREKDAIPDHELNTKSEHVRHG
jgi:metal-sulfur cluster biosynthetic enzyme